MLEIELLYQKLQFCNFKICTDTRKIEPESVFFALKGENFDGNQFAEKAIANGSKWAVIDNEKYYNQNTILVNDVLQTLQTLANIHRNKMKCKIIGIGGSNGKTTTKELLYSVMSKQYNTICTQGNYNNHIGVPLTLFNIKNDTEYAIVELGANKCGDIEELCSIAQPDWGLITNIGKEHLEGFGSLEGVAKAESELYYFLLKNNGIAFVNVDDEWLSRMSSRLSNKIDYSKNNENSDIYCKLLSDYPEIIFEFKNTAIKSKLTGLYNFENIMAAVAIAHIAGVSIENIKHGIENYLPKNKRSQTIISGSTYIFLDAYNANPSSMEKSLENFARFDYPNKIVILGDMFEMGEYAYQEHKNIYKLAKSMGFDKLFVAGEHFCCQARENNDICFENASEINNVLKSLNLANTAIFVKGSRGMAMEKSLDGLFEYNS
ncbi:MAG: UDP-N-acetylmuramoyl-tripeptide--D-alanyl-D-alanine ligase [Bacteroidia bacterium]|nr:UDP-N-acetylmuramoyl-tripeptide--D-alanyl-D-alanine ligase [Bacteroidia bacterium]